MLYEQIKLGLDYESMGLNLAGDDAVLTAYCASGSPEIDSSPRPAVLILPGGGYVMTSDREAEPIALSMLAKGIQAFVLRYSTAPSRYPIALAQAAAAMAKIREHAQRYGVDPDRIAIAGFSAGGHAAATLAVTWNQPWLSEMLGLDAERIRPNYLLLGYPVISSGEHAHRPSFENLTGTASEEKHRELSLETLVTEAVPPSFIWHTDADLTVPVENSLLFAAALKQHQVPLELHVYSHGGHGLSLGNKLSRTPDGYAMESSVTGWLDLFSAWLDRQSKEN